MHVAIPIYGKAVTDTGTVRCHAGMLTLLRRHGNVVMPAWQAITKQAETGMSLFEMDFCLWRTEIGKAEMALWQARFVVISALWCSPL